MALTALKKYNQWVNWKLVTLPDGTETKMPVNASSTDASTWCSFDEAVSTGRPVGFVFTDDDPFWFIDLDNCLVDDDWTADAKSVCEKFPGCAMEVSQSGTGLHLIGSSAPLEGKRRKKWGKPKRECYTTRRFIAMRSVDDWVGDASTDHTHALNEFVPLKAETGDAVIVPVSQSDQQLIETMLASRGGAAHVFDGKPSINDLWTANELVLGMAYPSQNQNDPFDRSSADAALMNHLAFYFGRDPKRMDAVFRQSALIREKYIERQDYRDATISNACSGTKNVYGASQEDEIPFKNEYLNLRQQIEYFKGCVYVADEHRVFTPEAELLKPTQFDAVYGGYEFQMSAENVAGTKRAFEAFTTNRMFLFPNVQALTYRAEIPTGETLTENGRTVVNIYRECEIERKKGDAAPILALLAAMFPDERDQTIILSYLAAVVQYPGVKFRWSLVLQGVEGCGKGIMFDFVRHAIGVRHVNSARTQDIKNKFNRYMAYKSFIIVEEAFVGHDFDTADMMKTYITDQTFMMEGKAADQQNVRNTANWGFCTNYTYAFPKSKNDRRYCLCFSALQEAEDLLDAGLTEKYFYQFTKWLEAEGYAIMSEFLHTYEIPEEFNPAKACVRAPVTSTTPAAIEASHTDFAQRILQAVVEEAQGFRDGWISSVKVRELKDVKPHVLNKELKNMGYVSVGVTTTVIMQEGNRKPTLYVHREKITDLHTNPALATDMYKKAQGYN